MIRSPEDTFNILVATDIHLGFSEDDPIRGEDSFNSFEEILQIAQNKDVDFILLGGDLFHENRPSANTFYKCISLLRKYCMGDKPVSIEFMSNQDEVFSHCSARNVNYEDPNLNISIPVFSIHGNHDDPAGHNCLGSMDVLSSTGHINYFAKWTDLTHVALTPLLLKKGSSKLAIYGLSHIKDERLARLFKDKRVEFQRPSDDADSWCSIMVLHQNRADRGPNKYLKEEALPSFLQLVIWGHEHECKVTPQYNANTGFRVMQPGSPVATSLSEGEAAAKHVAIVRVHQTDIFVEPIELETVRPFIFDTMDLSKVDFDFTARKPIDQVTTYVSERIESLLRRARERISGHANQPKLPLVRLRVEYNDEKLYFNPIRFGQRYIDRVANPKEMILMKRDKRGNRSKKGDNFDKDAMEGVIGDEDNIPDSQDDIGTKVGKVIELYFGDESNNKKLSVLSTIGINEAIVRFIEKEDKYALEAVIDHQKKKTVQYLRSKTDLTDESILECIEEFRQLRAAASKDEEEKEISMAIDENQGKSGANGDDIGMESDDDIPAQPTRGRGRGRGRGSRGGSTRAKTSPAKKSLSTSIKRIRSGEEEEEDSDDDFHSANVSTTSSRSRGRSKAAAAPRAPRGRRQASNTSTRGSRNTSQMSIQDMFSSEVSSITSPAKRRKMVFDDDSD